MSNTYNIADIFTKQKDIENEIYSEYITYKNNTEPNNIKLISDKDLSSTELLNLDYDSKPTLQAMLNRTILRLDKAEEEIINYKRKCEVLDKIVKEQKNIINKLKKLERTDSDKFKSEFFTKYK